MFNRLTVKDVSVKDKNVLIRVDYNVPLENGKITSDLRVRASLPTINYLFENGAKKVILMSHLGRPEGVDPSLSLAPVADCLKKLLPGKAVAFVPAVSGEAVEKAIEELEEGGILLLENLRFFPGEKANSEDFAKEIAASTKADLFVQDGFAVVHRADSSTDAITKVLPSVAGLLVEKEVSTLIGSMESPEHPVLVIIGGAKVDDKQPLIDKFLPIADDIIVGGKIAADGYKADDAKVYVAEDFATDDAGAKLDIGDQSITKIIELVKNAETIIWNGTLGLVEQPPFDRASRAVAEAIGMKTDATTVICGGDTAGFVTNLSAEKPNLEYSLVSTGGGASLALLSGEPLPGVESLEKR